MFSVGSTCSRGACGGSSESLCIGIAQSNQPLEEVTTPSVEALKLYTRARENHIRGDADAALPLIAPGACRSIRSLPWRIG